LPVNFLITGEEMEILTWDILGFKEK